MPAMTEAEVYQYLTKDGDSLPAVKKNTEMLRQHFTIESQRVAHTLSQLDPHNKDRHEAEAQRVYQENNAALDRVLMHIASMTPQKMPLPVEVINKASVTANVSKNQAKAVLSFPIVLFAALPAGLLYAVASAVSVALVLGVAYVVNMLTLKLDIASWMVGLKQIDGWFWAKVWYVICYVVAVVQGVRKVRSGASLWETFNELFFEPISAMLSSGKG